MIDYIKGGFILVLFILFFSSFGLALTKDNKSFPKNLLIGYILYSFFIGLLLIPIQILKLPWICALISALGVCIGILLFIVFRIKKYKLVLIKEKFGEWSKKYYFLFVIALILFLIYLLQFDLIWINNHLDDGYYLVKAATLPYLEQPFSVTYATGLISQSSGFDSYTLSSFETEASVFIYLFQIDPVIYCRAVLNIFHYFLAACTVYELANAIINSLKIKFDSNKIQYLSMVLIIFSFEYTILQKTGLLVVQDSWQFASAMWYGSSIVRVMGMIWIILPFIEKKQIVLKDILFVLLICFVLVSKSAIALSVIYVVGTSYLIAFYFTNRDKKMKFIGCVLTIMVAVVGIILPNVEVRNQLINDIFVANKYSILLWGCLLVVVLGGYYFRNLVTKRMLIILFVSFALMIVPELNDFFENISMYDFVARRAQTTLVYTFIIISFIFFFLFINKIVNKQYRLIQNVSLVLLLVLSLASMTAVYGNPINTYKIMAINNHLIPNSTVHLSKKLNTLSSKSNQLNVMLPEWVIDSNHRHSLSVMLRTYAPYVNSISAIGRFGVGEGNDFTEFTPEDQSKYDSFLSSPNSDTFNNLENVLNEYPINCLVFPNDCFEEYYHFTEFNFFEKIDNYYIYIK